MKDLDREKKIAVLIDAENAQRDAISAVLAELSKHGYILVKRAYGDWGSGQLRGWKEPLNNLAITPVQQFSYTQGKNSSDMAMVIDAMDLLYSERYDAFALVSSDSDFTKLASRIRESQVYVFGIGEEKTPIAFRNACDNFIPVEVLRGGVEAEGDAEESDASKSQSTGAKEVKQESPFDARLVDILRDSVRENSDDDGWALLAACGSLIKRQNPDFDTRTYGYAKLGELVEATKSFEVKHIKSGGGGTTIFVKDKHAQNN